MFPGRVVSYMAVDLGPARAALAVTLETAVLFLGAALVGSMALPSGVDLAIALRVLIVAGATASALLILGSRFTRLHEIASRLLRRPLLEDRWGALRKQVGLSWFLKVFLGSVVLWLILGVPFRLLAIGVSPAAKAWTWPQPAAIFAIAWCVGLLVLIAPGGIGVREAVLTALLRGFLSAGEALSVAVMARLWWTVTEALFGGAAMLWLLRDVRFPGQRRAGDWASGGAHTDSDSE